MKPIQIISQDLFDKVRSRFSNLEMGDETGAVTIDPVEARFFDFDFVSEGNNLGRVSISLNDLGSLKVYYSQGITENQDDPAKKEWYRFLKEMRFFAMRRLLRFDTRDIAKTNLDKNDFQHLAATQGPKEEEMTTMNESRWNNKSSRKTSRAVQGRTEVIVRHSKPVDEEYAGSRSQKKNIKAIFIQNADGERFKYPFIHTAGAFAMAQHVDHGGVPHDPAGKAIIKMSEQIAQLGEFHRKIQRTSLHDDAMGITERAIGRMNELKTRVEALGKRQHYENWMAEFNGNEMMDDGLEMDEVTMEEYKQKFTQTNFQEELAAYFPLLHKIMSETNAIDLEDYVSESDSENSPPWEDDEDPKSNFKKPSNPNRTPRDTAKALAQKGLEKAKSPAESIDTFAEWAEAVEQGKLTDDQIEALKQALEELPQGANGPELELGPEGQTAWQFFSELGIEDTDLEEKLKDMASVDSTTDALEIFKIWANENYPELAVALGMSGTEAPAEPAPEEQPAAENEEQGGMPNKTMPTREGVIKEVAKIVKSFYNRDNPEVGPFRGEENIAMDVKKKCDEMFGEGVGDKAQEMAVMFMEKLTKQWEQRHGKVQDDGLARLKELLNNVKAKVEGIGDKTNNGHAPGNNIMSAEEKNPQHSHQYDTTMKHADNPSVQQRMAAHDIKPGIAGYRDRIDMLKDLERTGKLKSNEDETDEGLGSKLLGGAAIIAALWGVNNHLANQAYEASPQLQKLTQFYQQAEEQHDVAKMKELERRIEDHKARLDLGHGDVMGKDGRPKEVVPEMADILKLAGLNR
jgi:hypothetical protein